MLCALFDTIILENPQEFLFDKAKNEMGDFIDKINNFEKITNSSLKDLWRIKDIGFQPLQVSLDI